MGRLFKAPPHPSEHREWILRQYEHLHDPSGHEFEWFVGEENRFKFVHRWVTRDDIWWLPEYDAHPKPIPRIEIRKWVERYLEGDVMIEGGSNSMNYEPKEADSLMHNTWHNRYWIDFRFETEEDLTHFLIKWT